MNAEMILVLLGYIFVLIVLCAMLIIAISAILVFKHWSAFKGQWDLIKKLPAIIKHASDNADHVYVFVNNNWPQLESYIVNKNTERINLERSFESLKKEILAGLISKESPNEFSPEQLVALNKIFNDAINDTNSSLKATNTKLDFMASYNLELGSRIGSIEKALSERQSQELPITERPTLVNQTISSGVDQFKTLVGGSPIVNKSTEKLTDPNKTIQTFRNPATDLLPNTAELSADVISDKEDMSRTSQNNRPIDTIQQKKVTLNKG